MLTLTDQATAVIDALVHQPSLPDGAGLRISTGDAGDESLAVTTAAAPEPSDEVLEDRGARVFLDPGAVAMLDDKILDASVSDGGRVQFLLASRPE